MTSPKILPEVITARVQSHRFRSNFSTGFAANKNKVFPAAFNRKQEER